MKFKSVRRNWDLNIHEASVLEYMLGTKKISGDLAIDVGAHQGTWSLPLSYAFKKVIAFEPGRITHKALLENLQANGIKNVQVVKSAVSDEISFTTLYIYYGNLGGSHTILKVHPSHSGSSKTREETVSTTTLDSVIKNSVDFIKIDVEGAENKVLLGAVKTINTHNPNMIIEIHGSMVKANEVINLLGYPNEVTEWGTPPWKLSDELQKRYGVERGNYFIYNRGEYDGIRRGMG